MKPPSCSQIKSVFLHFIAILFLPSLVYAHAIDEVEIKKVADGYEITLNFLQSLAYKNLSPQGAGKEFYIQLKAINFQALPAEDVNNLKERTTPTWNPNTHLPLEEITYDGNDDPERPEITLGFTEDVEIEAHSSADLKSLIINVKYEHPPQKTETSEFERYVPEPESTDEITQKTTNTEIKATETTQADNSEPTNEALTTNSSNNESEPLSHETSTSSEITKKTIPEDADLATLVEEAREALTLGDYDRSIKLYTKILQKADGAVRQQSQEFLGLAYERNKQLPHAKAEYQKYIAEYPNGPDSNRVRQRLSGLVTADKTPLPAITNLIPGLNKVVGTPGANIGVKEKPKWVVQNFGSFSQFYFRDQTKIEDSQTQVNRNDFSSDLYLNTKWKSDHYDINARLSGGRQQNFVKGQDSDNTLNAASVDIKDKETGWYGRIGRQSLTSGGVLGRFDGFYAAKQINPIMKINAVYGFPVDSVRHTDIETRKKFYGMSIDWGTFLKSWNFNTYAINQTNDGFTDRRAIGGEARYFDSSKALYSLLDYDIYFKEVNIFLLNGHWTLPTKTTFSMVLDYRKSPLMTTNNAIQGQGVSRLRDLKSSFSTSEIKQLAKDRTTNSKSVTAGITQDLNPNQQITGEVTASTTEGTVTSSGVDGAKEVRPDLYYSTQLITSNLFKENDVFITGLSLSDTLSSNTYSLSLDERFPFTPKFHVIPKIRVDFRDNKTTTGSRTTYRPILHMDYDLTRWARVELEGGIEYTSDHSGGIRQKSVESFVSSGYRLTF